jgi:hypothetical protein
MRFTKNGSELEVHKEKSPYTFNIEAYAGGFHLTVTQKEITIDTYHVSSVFISDLTEQELEELKRQIDEALARGLVAS